MASQKYVKHAGSFGGSIPRSRGPEMDSAYLRLDELLTRLETYRADLSPQISVDKFMEIVKLEEEISRLESRLAGYASLWFAEDTQNQQAMTLVAKIDQMMAEYGNRELLFSLWWKSLDDSNAERLMEASGDYLYWLEEMRHFKPHTLSEAEEENCQHQECDRF